MKYLNRAFQYKGGGGGCDGGGGGGGTGGGGGGANIPPIRIICAKTKIKLNEKSK